MSRETSILKSFVISLAFSAIMIAVALHSKWALVDLAKCFFITITFSTFMVCHLLVFSIASNAPSNSKSSKSNLPLKIVGFTLLFGAALYFFSKTLSLHEWLYDELASSVKGWEPRDTLEDNSNYYWLVKICADYLPFTVVLTLKLLLSFVSTMKRPLGLGFSEGMQFILYGQALLIVSLVLILKFLMPHLDESSFYIALIIIIFLPWQELLSSLGQLQGGY